MLSLFAWAKRTLSWLAIGIVAIGAALVTGYARGRSAAKSEAVAKQSKDKDKALEVSHEVNQMDDAAVRRSLRKWVSKE